MIDESDCGCRKAGGLENGEGSAFTGYYDLNITSIASLTSSHILGSRVGSHLVGGNVDWLTGAITVLENLFWLSRSKEGK